MADSAKAVDVLSPDECVKTHQAVHRLRMQWEQRDPELPFFTLGAASYLDAAQGEPALYRAKAGMLNPLLWTHFEWLYQKLAQILEREMGCHFFFDSDLALPGFHIFLAHPEFTKPRASMHFDLQHQKIPWKEPEMALAGKPLSMTLAIRLPAAGGGLFLWNLSYPELQALPPEERTKLAAANRKAVLVPYDPGRMLLHSGYQLHQMAPAKDLKPDDERLTLQAHAHPVGQGYVLYW